MPRKTGRGTGIDEARRSVYTIDKTNCFGKGTYAEADVAVHFENLDVGEGARYGTHNGQQPNHGGDDHRETRRSSPRTLNNKSRQRPTLRRRYVYPLEQFLFMGHSEYQGASFASVRARRGANSPLISFERVSLSDVQFYLRSIRSPSEMWETLSKRRGNHAEKYASSRKSIRGNLFVFFFFF